MRSQRQCLEAPGSPWYALVLWWSRRTARHLLKGNRRRALGHRAGRLCAQVVGLGVDGQAQVLDHHVNRTATDGAACGESAPASVASAGHGTLYTHGAGAPRPPLF